MGNGVRLLPGGTPKEGTSWVLPNTLAQSDNWMSVTSD